VFALVGCTPTTSGGPSSPTTTSSTTTTTISTNHDHGETLDSGQVLGVGDYLHSPSQQFRLVMGSDGNVTLWAYLSDDGVTARATWSTGTAGSGATTLEMQSDGNLVLYTASRTPVWTSNTSGQPSSHLRLQDDSNLSIWNTAGQRVWQSGPSHDTLRSGEGLQSGWSLNSTNGVYRLLMQTDGKLALIANSSCGASCSGGTQTWASPTEGQFNETMQLQGDGNLIVFASSGVPVWSAPGTFGHATRVVLQNDGNVVAYDAGGTPVWSSATSSPGPGVIGDDYPANLKSAGKDALVDPWLFYNRECTSFVAWRLNSANGISFGNYYGGPQWGNANHWDDAATTIGKAPNSTPARGAIAQTDAGTSGHVAWVASVNADGTVTVEEYNFSPAYGGTYSTRTVPAGSFRYIHLHDL
jgi:surface antigen